MTTLAVILFCTIVLPMWLVLHYLTKWRTSRALSKDESELLEQLWRSSKRFEERIDVLETILDAKTQTKL